VPSGAELTLIADVSDTGTGVRWVEYSLDGGLTWLLMNSQDGTFDENIETAEITFLAPTASGTYPICVRLGDGAGNVAMPACGNFTVNEPPTGVSAGGPYSSDEGQPVDIVGSASDPEGDSLVYTWSYLPGPAVDSGASCTFGMQQLYQRQLPAPTMDISA